MIDHWRQSDGAIDWARFLQTLEAWCEEFGWILEYGDADDAACAIFYQEPSAGNNSACTGASNDIS